MNDSNRAELSDDDLVARLVSLSLETSRLKAEIVVYLIEVEERRLHLRMACKSMSDFCINRLMMSTNVAFQRIAAAGLIRKHPCLLPLIARGELHLSTLVLLKNHLTAANAKELVAEIHGKSFRDVELLLAARAPRPDIPATIGPVVEQAVPSVSSGSASPTPKKTPARVTPLSPARFAVQLTVSQEVRDRLERAKEMLRHRWLILVSSAVKPCVRWTWSSSGTGASSRLTIFPEYCARPSVFSREGAGCAAW